MELTMTPKQNPAGDESAGPSRRTLIKNVGFTALALGAVAASRARFRSTT
jgi:hypothetical protein